MAAVCKLFTNYEHELPDSVEILSVDSGIVYRYLPKRMAKRIRVPYQSHVAIGHYECGACGETIEPSDKYCSACGAGLEDE